MKYTPIIHFLTVALVSVCSYNTSAAENDAPLAIPTI
jgi:hypothetical protein